MNLDAHLKEKEFEAESQTGFSLSIALVLIWLWCLSLQLKKYVNKNERILHIEILDHGKDEIGITRH